MTRLTIGFGVAGPFGFSAAAIVPYVESDFRLAAGALIALLPLWGLVDALATALAAGALSSLLYRRFLAVLGVIVPVDAAATKARERRPLPAAAMLLGLAAIVVVGFVAGSRILASIRTTDQGEVIAHRSGGAARPGNTIAAIQHGIEDGADWIEIDVRETVGGSYERALAELLRPLLAGHLVVAALLAVAATLSDARNTGHDDAHGFDPSINPTAIDGTVRLGPRSFSPYFTRSFPTRPL